VKISSVLLALALPVLAYAQPDPTKPITNLVIEELGGSLRSERPMVVQWWHDEGQCKLAVKELTKRFMGQRVFVCVRVLGDDV
jgi:hypothetical protein